MCRGVAKDLEVPFWARDPSEQGVDRSLDLPCFGKKLKGDTEPPFTCGSDTRRSIIKYFVRDKINENSEGNNLAESLVRKRIAFLKEAWSNASTYACDCKGDLARVHGNHSLTCCRSYDDEAPATGGYTDPEPCTCLDGESSSVACCYNNFMPSSLGGVLFDEVTADEVVAEITGRIDPYLKEIFTKAGNSAFKKYNDPDKVGKWDWVAQGKGALATEASGLYSTQAPIMAYNASEAGYPFRKEATIWEMCAGLVSQVRMSWTKFIARIIFIIVAISPSLLHSGACMHGRLLLHRSCPPRTIIHVQA
jgi:hypothetical protein